MQRSRPFCLTKRRASLISVGNMQDSFDFPHRPDVMACFWNRRFCGTVLESPRRRALNACRSRSSIGGLSFAAGQVVTVSKTRQFHFAFLSLGLSLKLCPKAFEGASDMSHGTRFVCRCLTRSCESLSFLPTHMHCTYRLALVPALKTMCFFFFSR